MRAAACTGRFALRPFAEPHESVLRALCKLAKPADPMAEAVARKALLSKLHAEMIRASAQKNPVVVK